MQRCAREPVLLGLILILVGTYSLLGVLYSQLPGLGPPVAGRRDRGRDYPPGRVLPNPQRETSRVFWGVALTLSGLFLLLITLTDRNYAVLQTWWPAFVAIAGISFLALWIAEGFRDWSVLFLAIVSLIFGGVSIAVNLHLFGPNTIAGNRPPVAGTADDHRPDVAPPGHAGWKTDGKIAGCPSSG